MTSRTRWWTFAVVCAALFMSMLDNLVVLTALPAIRRSLHAGVPDLEWTVNAYTLSFAVLMMTGAALGDRFGRKRIFLLGVATFTIGSALAATSDGATTLSMARAVQGVGAAFLTPLTLTLLTRVFPENRRAAAIGLWSGISGLGLAIGPLVGGAIVSGISWNAIFWLNVPVGVLVVCLGWLRLEESFGDRKPLDLPGLLLAGFGLLGIVYGLVRGNSVGWSSLEITCALAGGTALLATFVWWERRSRTPMLQLSLFKVRQFSAANGVGFLMSAGMFGSIFLLTLFIQQIQGANPLEAGLKTMPWTGTIMLVAPIAGIFAGRIGPRLLVTAGMISQATALLWIGILAHAGTAYPVLLPAFLLGGLGMGLTYAPLSAGVMAAVSDNRQGEASGAYNAIRELGGVFGVAVLGAVFQHVATSKLSFVDGFHTAVFAGAGVVLLGVFAALFLSGSRLTGSPATAETTLAAA
ncbi:MAG TPA: MFS transporter [Chloroflexota bacterium]|nr:MFS transporter [Chloroflexota bacterium]